MRPVTLPTVLCFVVLMGLELLSVSAALAEQKPPTTVAQSGFEETIVVHGKALEGNLEGNSADREVTVFLPPTYYSQPKSRYPVVYALHGYTINNTIFKAELKAGQGLGKAFKKGVTEMIVVIPNAQTLHNGSMYSSSVTIGDWETFIAEDLVTHIDAHYRTLAARENRGLMGHSMGGYGASRIGMKRPDVFSALYIMSPCCLSAREAPPTPLLKSLQSIKKAESATKRGFLERATLAVAAAWSPNPNNPPFYADLPLGDQQHVQSVLANWAANAPLSMASQYIPNLKRHSAIAIDVGDQDNFKHDAKSLSDILTASGVSNTFEIYEGDHGNRVAERFQQKVLPFFGRHITKPSP